MKTSLIIAAYNALSGSKLTKMTGPGRIKIVKNVMAMKSIHASYTDFVQETIKRFKPEWMEGKKEEEWRKNGMNSTTLTSTEKAEAQHYIADADTCLKEEFEKDHDLNIRKLTEEEFEQFAESNDYTAGELIDLMDVLT